MERFCVIAGHHFQVGLNFSNEKNERTTVDKIKDVWKYYQDFSIVFSGAGKIDLFRENAKNDLIKIFSKQDYCYFLEDIIELKESTFEYSNKSKQMYLDEIKKQPLRKFMFKKMIDQLEYDVKKDKRFIEDLKELVLTVKEYSI